MKVLLLVISFSFIIPALYAQQRVPAPESERQWVRNNLNLRLGPEIGFAIGDFNETQAIGVGGSALLDIPVAPRFSVVGYAGYISFTGDRINTSSGLKYTRSTIFPIRAGINYKLSDNFYTGVQLGHASMRYLQDTKSGLSQALVLGYFNGKLDAGVRWDHQYMHGGLGSFNLKLAYVLQLGLRR